MTTNKTTCKAKNPDTCPYHGNPNNASNSLKSRLKALTSGKPVFFTPFNKKTDEVSISVIIKPNAKNSTMDPVYIEVDGSSHEDANKIVSKTLKGLRLKEYKSGYSADIYIPTSDNEGSVAVKYYESTTRDPFDDESVTETGNEGFKQAIAAKLNNAATHNAKFNAFIEEIKDSKMAQSVNGAKAIAVVEAMNEFKYFHLENRNHTYEVESAFQSILSETREYTNRGWGIRVHMDYKQNGELQQARFSLDQPNSRFNSFTQTDVDKINSKLQNYLDSFDK